MWICAMLSKEKQSVISCKRKSNTKILHRMIVHTTYDIYVTLSVLQYKVKKKNRYKTLLATYHTLCSVRNNSILKIWRFMEADGSMHWWFVQNIRSSRFAQNNVHWYFAPKRNGYYYWFVNVMYSNELLSKLINCIWNFRTQVLCILHDGKQYWYVFEHV